ncbi:methyltransferase domain-containing protein [Paenibacillus sp. NPDC058071]|uniref:methyltransferase domain-containing protein n=1 Tax=Paenibacillus sp. NPDC058071 TaxID=3346326 RepID=UPI0036D7F16C
MEKNNNNQKVEVRLKMTRVLTKEWLDEGEASLLAPSELETSLEEVWNVNRFLGGNPSLFAHLDRLLQQAGQDKRPVSLLDVGTGLADIPLAYLRRCRKRGVELSIVGIDSSVDIVMLAEKRTAAERDIRIVRADGRALPFGDKSFDIAFSNLALHHMDDDEAMKLLSELSRVSRVGWVVTDLERHPVAYAAARLLAAFVWRSPITKHDGPLSVRRSFTAVEARRLVERSGVNGRVYRHFPCRLALVGHGHV